MRSPKLRRSGSGYSSIPPARASAVEWNRTQEDTSEAGGREARETDGPELGADHAFGPGAGQYDRLEPAAVIDHDGVDQQGDFLSGMGEAGENVANEANCDESMSAIEVHDTFQVIANSDAFSGLDKGGNRAGEPHAGTGD
jgi:hypothetical protein